MRVSKVWLRKELDELKRATRSERVGVAWQHVDGTIVFHGESFTDPDEFKRVYEGKGYTTMYVVKWATEEPKELKSCVGIHKSQI